jgi:hypothetical protein
MTTPDDDRAIVQIHRDLLRLDSLTPEHAGFAVQQAMRAFLAGELTRPRAERKSSPPWSLFEPLDLAAAERELHRVASSEEH